MVTVKKNKMKDASELQQALLGCFRNAKKELSNKTVNFNEARKLIAYLDRLRGFLLELHAIRNTPHSLILMAHCLNQGASRFEIERRLKADNVRPASRKRDPLVERKSA